MSILDIYRHNGSWLFYDTQWTYYILKINFVTDNSQNTHVRYTMYIVVLTVWVSTTKVDLFCKI